MTGRGNNTYLLPGEDGEAILIDAGVGEPQHLAEIARQLAAHRAQLRRVLVTHAHADHASGAPALAAGAPARDVRQVPLARGGRSISGRLDAARRRRPCESGSGGDDPLRRAPHSRTLAGSSGVLARINAHRVHRRSDRRRQQRDDPREPRRQPRSITWRRSSGCWRWRRACCFRRTGRAMDDPRRAHSRLSGTPAHAGAPGHGRLAGGPRHRAGHRRIHL